MVDPYSDREQTKAKHFILKSYLQALAFKVLTFSDVAYVDGFSGPWQTKTESFSDSSFMIAISVLQDAQRQIQARGGRTPRIRCFFSENDPTAYAQLERAVASFHRPEEGFEIKTFCGRFENAIGEIQTFIGAAFPLVFIDPTGWSGYPLDKIKPLFARPRCEVLINFMYDFINRFAASDDEDIIASLAPILGGIDWPRRLDTSLPRGLAVEKLFRETLKAAWNLEFVVSTKIDKATTERPHFFITYGTKNADGLKTFRQIEYDALRQHAKNRAFAMEKKREGRSSIANMFADHEADLREAGINEIVTQHKILASDRLLTVLSQHAPIKFSRIVTGLLQPYMLRETNIKDICIELAKAGKIQNTWGGGNRKPRDDDLIKLASG